MQTAAGQSGARNNYMLCVQKPVSERVRNRKVSGTSTAFRSILSKILALLGGRSGALWGSKGEAVLTVGPPLGLHLNETSENGLLFPGALLPGPAIVFSHFGVILLKYSVLPNLVINLMLQEKNNNND